MEEKERFTNALEIEEKKEDIKIEPLVKVNYSYENIKENPILKPIVEADKSLRVLEEMIVKYIIDANTDKEYVNSMLLEVPRYNLIPFISRLLKLVRETQYTIKLQDLIIKELRECVQEMFETNNSKYGVKVDDKGRGKEPETKIPSGSYENYLKNLITNPDPLILELSKRILDGFNKNEAEKDLYKRFANACTSVYKEEMNNRKNKEIIGKIIRMEI